MGGVGNDVLNFDDEEDGDDVVSGGSGDDDLHAGVGLDRLFGNHGRDTLREGEVDAPMIDLFAGGAGIDSCSPGPRTKSEAARARSRRTPGIRGPRPAATGPNRTSTLQELREDG